MRFKWARWTALEKLFVAGGIAVAFAVAWFTSNFFYTLFWAYLDRWKFKEADVIAYTLANLAPFTTVIILSATFYFFVRREMARQLELSPARLREIEAQEKHAAELRRHTDALEREERANTPIQRAFRAAFEHRAPVKELEYKSEEPFPNWPISELFSYIDPDMLTRADCHVDQLWDKIGNQIRDYASVGRLKIWGRPTNDGVDVLLGQRPSIRLIDPSYWAAAFFTYSFFDSTSGDAAHTYLKFGQHGSEYTDLQVNRAEASQLWFTEQKPIELIRPKSPLEISVGTSIDFYDLVRERPSIYSLKKRFKIRVENTDPTKTISGVKIAIISVHPLDGNYRFPWILGENGSINPGDHAHVPLAIFEERREPEKYPDQPAAYDTFEVPAVSDRTLLLGIENEYKFQLRCTANDVPATDATIAISVLVGRMRIEKI
jgi:hypothetical protein